MLLGSNTSARANTGGVVLLLTTFLNCAGGPCRSTSSIILLFTTSQI